MGRTNLLWVAACIMLASCAGEPSIARIGPAGGVLVSGDGQLRLEVPAGVLAKTTTIAIATVEERAPHGLGRAYRVAPADVALSGPVRLVFDKREENEVAVAVASRNADGSWLAHLDAVFSSFEATLTVETTEFSTWSLIEMVKLEPTDLRARVGAAKELQVTICLDDYASLFSGAVRAKVADTCRPWTLSDRVIRWEVYGLPGGREEIGTVAGDGSRATYRAPTAIPDHNPVWISAVPNIPGRPEGRIGVPLTLIPNDCPEGICLIECAMESETFIAGVPEHVSHQEHRVVLEYHHTDWNDHWFTAIDSGTERIMDPECTVELLPDGAAEVQQRTTFRLTRDGDTLTYWGSGGVTYDRVERWACEDGWSNDLHVERASIGWFLDGVWAAPYDSFSGRMEDGAWYRSWDCVVVR
ncbi:hypothetical protein [Vulgatibacter incomptus]|uniref:Lipoprotein n=1 Tax=Vulgatibacter incomptus TaxID=1391653 RepID=A0A0K1P858_9BACT|nr:hypothetical protein [Vulgatibacter incomptus]AKU89697.1 hypothetical protein AKJ08_0084 [Vulgatibacter incomptus]